MGKPCFFEDAVPDGQLYYEEPHRAHPLASPNPTSYQLYLEQKYNSDEKRWEELRHWDSDDARPRGYKLYWHNAKKDAWHAPDEEIKAIDMDRKGKMKHPDKQLTREIKPISKGVRFRTRIRFSNLKPEELGALLMVFYMENAQNIAYKLGKGKSIGLGSIRIVQKSLLLEDNDQYRQLFAADGWNNPCIKKDEGYYLEEFRKYIKDNTGMENTWQHVLGDLAAMLEWRKGWDEGKVSEKWDNATKVMRPHYVLKNDKWSTVFNEQFLRRDVLLTVKEVIKEATEEK